MKKIKNKKDSIKKELIAGKKYLIESIPYIISIIGIFILSSIIGFIFTDKLSFLDSLLKQIIDKTENLSSLELIIYIFVNNLWSALTGFLGGIALGILPVLNALLNGTILGYVFSRLHKITGFQDFWRILPHGIFELPAIFISLGIGLKLGLFIFSKKPIAELKYRIMNGLRVFFLIVLPLLLVAAIIEGLLIAYYK